MHERARDQALAEQVQRDNLAAAERIALREPAVILPDVGEETRPVPIPQTYRARAHLVNALGWATFAALAVAAAFYGAPKP